jgi:hypothetical protein
MQGGKKLDFAEIDKCKPVLLRLLLAGNLEKPLMSLYGTRRGSVAMDSEVPDVNGECDVHIGFGTAVVGHAVLLTRHACTHVANNVPCRDTTCDIHVKGTVFCCFHPF